LTLFQNLLDYLQPNLHQSKISIKDLNNNIKVKANINKLKIQPQVIKQKRRPKKRKYKLIFDIISVL